MTDRFNRSKNWITAKTKQLGETKAPSDQSKSVPADKGKAKDKEPDNELSYSVNWKWIIISIVIIVIVMALWYYYTYYWSVTENSAEIEESTNLNNLKTQPDLINNVRTGNPNLGISDKGTVITRIS